MSAISSSSTSFSPPSSTMGSTSSSANGPLLPVYTFLSHCIYHNLTKASPSSSSSSSSSSSQLSLSLSLDVSSIVASFLWYPHHTATHNTLHTRARWLPNHPSLPHCTGEVHADTQQYDTYSADLHSRIMRGYRLRAVHGWGGQFANGLGFTYCHPNDTEAVDTFEVDTVYGAHHSPQLSHFQLAAGERIVQVSIICNVYMQAVRFDTSDGRQYQVGRAEHRRYWQPLLPTADKLPAGRQAEALAFMFGVGGHLHNLGVRYQLLSPPAVERVYESAEVMAAVMGRAGVVSHTVAEAADVSMGVSSGAVSEGRSRPGGEWARAFQLGRVGGHSRIARTQQHNTEQQQQQQQQ